MAKQFVLQSGGGPSDRVLSAVDNNGTVAALYLDAPANFSNGLASVIFCTKDGLVTKKPLPFIVNDTVHSFEWNGTNVFVCMGTWTPTGTVQRRLYTLNSELQLLNTHDLGDPADDFVHVGACKSSTGIVYHFWNRKVGATLAPGKYVMQVGVVKTNLDGSTETCYPINIPTPRFDNDPNGVPSYKGRIVAAQHPDGSIRAYFSRDGSGEIDEVKFPDPANIQNAIVTSAFIPGGMATISAPDGELPYLQVMVDPWQRALRLVYQSDDWITFSSFPYRKGCVLACCTIRSDGTRSYQQINSPNRVDYQGCYGAQINGAELSVAYCPFDANGESPSAFLFSSAVGVSFLGTSLSRYLGGSREIPYLIFGDTASKTAYIRFPDSVPAPIPDPIPDPNPTPIPTPDPTPTLDIALSQPVKRKQGQNYVITVSISSATGGYSYQAEVRHGSAPVRALPPGTASESGVAMILFNVNRKATGAYSVVVNATKPGYFGDSETVWFTV